MRREDPGRREAARASAPETSRSPSMRPPGPRGGRPRSQRWSSQVQRELVLEARPWLGAVDRRLRLAVCEEDDSRKREDAVPPGDARLLVDVHADEAHALPPLLRESDEVRLDRRTGPAPRCPEVDDDRHGRVEHLPLEGLAAHDVHRYSLPVRARRRSTGTLHIASATIEPVIFDEPARRSTNVIGTSVTRSPARLTRYVVSIWKAYP